MKKKLLSISMCAALALSLITGCGAGSESGSSSSSSSDVFKIGAIGPLTGGAAAYGVNRSGSNSIEKTKKDKETGGPLVYIDQAGNKDSKTGNPKMANDDKNIVEDDAEKSSENL